MPAVPQMRSGTGRGIARQCIGAWVKGGRGIMNDIHTERLKEERESERFPKTDLNEPYIERGPPKVWCDLTMKWPQGDENVVLER